MKILITETSQFKILYKVDPIFTIELIVATCKTGKR